MLPLRIRRFSGFELGCLKSRVVVGDLTADSVVEVTSENSSFTLCEEEEAFGFDEDDADEDEVAVVAVEDGFVVAAAAVSSPFFIVKSLGLF